MMKADLGYFKLIILSLTLVLAVNFIVTSIYYAKTYTVIP